MKTSLSQLMTGVVVVGTLGSGVFIPAHAITIYNLNFAPEATGATGSGTGTLTYDDLAHTLTIVSSFSGLSGNTTNAHIHAPTAIAGKDTAGVAVPFLLNPPNSSGFPLGVQSGSYNTVLNLALDSTYNTTFRNNNGGTASGAESALISSFNAGTAYYNTYILQQNKRTTGGKGQESGKRSRSEKTAKQWKPFLYKPRP